MTELRQDLPFGTYRLAPPREWLRRQAGHLPNGKAGRIMASVMRRFIVGRGQGPFDVEVFPTINARLYPTTNRCEKRALTAVQFFDREERDFISEMIAHSKSDPFVLVDLGANVGLYGLAAVSEARRFRRGLQVVAVEPDPTTRGRLEANIAFSGARPLFTVVPVGVGAERSVGAMEGHASNRGQHKVVTGLGTKSSVSQIDIVPLMEICRECGIGRIDLLKIDVEGHDFAVLKSFLASAPTTLRPGAIIVEVGREADSAPAVDLVRGYGYQMVQRTRLNAIMVSDMVGGHHVDVKNKGLA